MYLTEFNEERAIRGWRQEGLEEGLAEGRAKGREEGREEKAVEAARNFKAAGVDVNIISKCVGLSVEEVEKL